MPSTPSHPVAISNAGDDQSALLNQLRERALASVDDPNTTLAIFEWSAERWLRRKRLGRDSLGYAGARLHGLARSDLVLASNGPAPDVQDRGDVPERPVAQRTRFPAGVVLLRGPRPDHQGRRAPSLITSRITGSPSVCDSMPGVDSLEPPGKIEPAPLRDRLDLIVAGTTSPSPSAFHILDHLVAGAP
jgi:hypothetical protein